MILVQLLSREVHLFWEETGYYFYCAKSASKSKDPEPEARLQKYGRARA